MANTKSAEKQNRQRIKRETRNRARKSAMRSAVKKVRAAIGKKDATGADAALKEAARALDRAAQKGVVKRGTASRSVSRLTTAVKNLRA